MPDITVAVDELDRQIRFCQSEIQGLGRIDQPWARSKMESFERVAETLRQVRQFKQMGGIGGRQLDAERKADMPRDQRGRDFGDR